MYLIMVDYFREFPFIQKIKTFTNGETIRQLKAILEDYEVLHK